MLVLLAAVGVLGGALLAFRRMLVMEAGELFFAGTAGVGAGAAELSEEALVAVDGVASFTSFAFFRIVRIFLSPLPVALVVVFVVVAADSFL